MREKVGNVLWGLVLIAIGVLVFGRVMGWWTISLLFPGWWTLFLIIPCTIGVIKNGPRPVNLILLLCGVLLLLERNGVVQSGTLGKILVPAIFMIIGLYILFQSLFVGSRKRYNGSLGYTATFGGNVVMPPAGEGFQGCEADAVFGGLDLDLRDVVIEDGAVIEASAIFGGIDIKVPEGVNVKVRQTSLFGGAGSHISNHSGNPVLYVNALCMFGGVDVK